MKATGDTWSQHVLSSNGLAKYIIATSSSTNAAKGSTLNPTGRSTMQICPSWLAPTVARTLTPFRFADAANLPIKDYHNYL